MWAFPLAECARKNVSERCEERRRDAVRYDKDAVLSLLQRKEIAYRIVEHKRVFTSEEGKALGLPDGARVAKNLFLRDDKKQQYYLAVVQQNRRLNLKALRARLGSRPLTFASEEDLMRLLGLSKGAVTPFGVLHDEAGQVQVLLDEYFLDGQIGVHPNENTATVWLDAADLAALLAEYAHPVSWLNFS